MKGLNALSELKYLIDAFLEKNPGFTLCKLAQTSKVSYSILRSAYNEEVMLDPVNLLKIVGSISKETNIARIIDQSPQEIKNILELSFSILCDLKKQDFEKRYTEVLYDYDTFVIFNLASHTKGVHREEITRKMGSMALDKIAHLKDEGLVIENSEGILTTAGSKNPSFPLDVCKKQISNYARFYSPSGKGNYLHLASQSVNKETYVKIWELHKNLHQEISDLISNDNNVGDYHIFSVAFMDNFMRSELENESV